jgi:hypothetical protein
MPSIASPKVEKRCSRFRVPEALTAQRTAPSMLSDVTRSESPPVCTTFQPCSRIVGSISARRNLGGRRSVPALSRPINRLSASMSASTTAISLLPPAALPARVRATACRAHGPYISIVWSRHSTPPERRPGPVTCSNGSREGHAADQSDGTPRYCKSCRRVRHWLFS